jgi:PilZ domain
MIKDKRRTRRRSISHPGWILLGPKLSYPCALSDVSDNGARLEVEDASKLPARFFLLLSKRGTVRRACGVVWRKPKQVGVKFERGARRGASKFAQAMAKTAAEQVEPD